MIAEFKEELNRDEEFKDHITKDVKLTFADACSMMTPEELSAIVHFLEERFPDTLREHNPTPSEGSMRELETQIILDQITHDIWEQLKPFAERALIALAEEKTKKRQKIEESPDK